MRHQGTNRIVEIAVIMLMICIPTRSHAAGLGTCGSTAYQRYLVPDGLCVLPNGDIRPFVCNMPQGRYVSFTSACSEHDGCYSSRGANKSTCDARFYKGMTTACRDALPNTFPEAGRKACYQTAIHYNDVVRSQACPAFRRAQSVLGVSNPRC